MRALFAEEGRCFAVGGAVFGEIFADGTFEAHGTVGEDDKAATISSNGSQGQQLFIVSNGDGFIFNVETDTFTPITDEDFPSPCTMGAFIDGYFLALKGNSVQFHISALFDGLDWDPLDVAQVSQTTGQVRAMVAVHRDLWLLGTSMTTVWADIGDPDFPFAPIPGAFLAAGHRVARRLGGARTTSSTGMGRTTTAGAWPTARRAISRSASRRTRSSRRGRPARCIDDTVCWSYQERGHFFVAFYIPDAETTWVYDAATQAWHERALWDPDARGLAAAPGALSYVRVRQAPGGRPAECDGL